MDEAEDDELENLEILVLVVQLPNDLLVVRQILGGDEQVEDDEVAA